MQIVLIQPPIEDFFTTPIRFYPLGLLYTASVLEHYGHDVSILDCLTPFQKCRLPLPSDFDYLRRFLNGNQYFFKNYYKFGLSNRQIIQRIDDLDPDLIGISSNFTAYYKSVEDLVKRVKDTRNRTDKKCC